MFFAGNFITDRQVTTVLEKHPPDDNMVLSDSKKMLKASMTIQNEQSMDDKENVDPNRTRQSVKKGKCGFFKEPESMRKVHGEAKRVCLKKCLQAVMHVFVYTGEKEIVYLDGFSGEGAYPDPEGKMPEHTSDVPVEKFGSPVIALDCALDCFRDITEKLKKQEEETGISAKDLVENPNQGKYR